MPRLPRPGSDTDIWGEILNDFLNVAHNNDGTLKADSTITDAQTKADSAVQTVNGKSGPNITLTASDIGVSGSGGSGTLAGDSDVTITNPVDGNVLTYESGTWQNSVPPSAPVSSVAGKTGAVLLDESDITGLTNDLASKASLDSPTFTGTVTVPTPTANSAAATKAYVDGTVAAGAPDANTTTPGLVQLSGDLAGTYNAPTVPGLTSKASSATTITGIASITGGGDLTANRTLSLVNDVASPGNSLYYGTDLNGIKGYFAVANLNPTPVNVCPSFSYTGIISAFTGDYRWYNDTGRSLTVNTVRASLGSAPAGSSAIFDVLLNGSTIFTTAANRPTVAAGSNTALSGTPDTKTINNGAYLTISISQVGSTAPGADLTLTVVMS